MSGDGDGGRAGGRIPGPGGWGRGGRGVKVAQSCPTLWDPMDCCLPHSSVHGISQAGVLEWVAISFSRGSSQDLPNPGIEPRSPAL